MKRAELISIVESCADRAGMLTTDKDALVKAVSDPSVTRVARGTWRERDGCECPALLARLVTIRKGARDPDMAAAHVDAFVSAFDSITGKLTFYAPIIEIEP